MATGTKSPNSDANRPKSSQPEPKPADARSPAPRSEEEPSSSRTAARSADGAPRPKVGPTSRFAMLANPKHLAAVAAVAIAANLVAFYFLRLRYSPPPSQQPNLEMPLGAFDYIRMNPRDKQVKRGQILVTLRLSAKLDAKKLRNVHDQETDLRAAVEDAMRRVRASDLADMRFTRLRNRLLERLNEQLGIDGIEEVVVKNAPESAADPSSDPQAAGSDIADAPPPAATDAAAPAN